MDKKSCSWIFLGPEIGEKQIAIDKIKKELSSGGQPEETIYYAGDMPVQEIVANMRNSSLFSDSRLFFIKCAEVIKKKEDTDLLAAYIKSPPADTFLIMVSDETGISKALENAAGAANKRVFWELLESRKSEWVRDFFKQEGFRISAGGVETILEFVENNTAALKQECWRLTLFLDKAKEISGEDAEKWLSHSREESTFTLFSRIAAGDLSRSLESARILSTAKVAAPAIFAGLAYCFRKLSKYIELKESGTGDDFEYRKIGVSSPGAKRDYAAAGKRFNSAAAETCLALTAEYDLLLRSSLSFPKQILMDQYLYKVHSLARP